MIANISPESKYTDESVSTCHFAQRVALVKNSASVNEKVDPELVIQRLRAEVRRLRGEVDFLSGKHDDDEGSSNGGKQDCTLSQEQMDELTESIHKYVQNRDKYACLEFCGGMTIHKIHAACSIFKETILRGTFDEKNATKMTSVAVVDDDRVNSDSEEDSSEEKGQSLTGRSAAFGIRKVSTLKRPPAAKIAEKIILQQNDISKKESNKVCGTPICTDKRTVDEPNLAFEGFKERYPGRVSIDECKNKLKMKYSEVFYDCFHWLFK